MSSQFRWIGREGKEVKLRAFEGHFQITEGVDPQDICQGMALDLETTGLNRTEDRVIEIGMRPFLFCKKTGALAQVLEGYHAMEDPGVPLSDTITRLTGITDEDLRGKSIDWKHVGTLLEKTDIVIAHNASFDRGFMDRYQSVSEHKIWGCSHVGVPWEDFHFPSSKLELLCIYHGFFVDAHRALEDADALLHLLSFKPDDGEKTYLKYLLDEVKKPRCEVLAIGAPFESKDELKMRGYRWDGAQKFWRRTIEEAVKEEEMAFLEKQVYFGTFRGQIRSVKIHDQFKS